MIREARQKLRTDGLNSLLATAPPYANDRITGLCYDLSNRLWSAQNKERAVMAEDWDILIVLDACRYDAFAGTHSFDGTLSQFTSLASSSKQWLEANFIGQKYHDTVYISGNAYTPEVPDKTFHSIQTVRPQSVYDSDIDVSVELPGDSYAVLPENMVTAARHANEKFPNKRLIVHMMQPHVPLISPEGLSLYADFYSKFNAEEYRRTGLGSRFGALSVKLYEAVQTGVFDVPHRRLVRAYRQNLELVYPYVETLIRELKGKTVVTADHGELLGERIVPFGAHFYSHPSWVYNDILRTVPWLTVEDSERRSITADPPVQSDRLSDQEAEEQLKALGYL